MEASRDAAVREIAEMLLSRYGEHAAAYASLKAFLARHHGRQRHIKAWGRITDAVIQAMHVEWDAPGTRHSVARSAAGAAMKSGPRRLARPMPKRRPRARDGRGLLSPV